MKKATVLSGARKARGRPNGSVGVRRNSVENRSEKSLVDEMLGSAELRAPSPGTDLLYDGLHARHVALR